MILNSLILNDSVALIFLFNGLLISRKKGSAGRFRGLDTTRKPSRKPLGTNKLAPSEVLTPPISQSSMSSFEYQITLIFSYRIFHSKQRAPIKFSLMELCIYSRREMNQVLRHRSLPLMFLMRLLMQRMRHKATYPSQARWKYLPRVVSHGPREGRMTLLAGPTTTGPVLAATCLISQISTPLQLK